MNTDNSCVSHGLLLLTTTHLGRDVDPKVEEFQRLFVVLIDPVYWEMPMNSVAENVSGTLGEPLISFQLFVRIDVHLP